MNTQRYPGLRQRSTKCRILQGITVTVHLTGITVTVHLTGGDADQSLDAAAQMSALSP
jgi:hypothetical protein